MKFPKLIKFLRNPKTYLSTIPSRIVCIIFQLKMSKERKICNGNEYSDRIFYIIGVDCGNRGIMQIMLHVLYHIIYAENNNYTPIVDMKNFQSQYSDGNINAWECFFRQPTQYSLDTIKKAKNIIYSQNNPNPPLEGYEYFDLLNKEKTRYYRILFQKKIIYNYNMRKYIKNQYDSIIGDKKNILGVLCRGTDFVCKRPPLHPVQPSVKEVLEKAYGVMETNNCSYLFLATEDSDILEAFRNKFGNKLLSIEQKRYSSNDVAELNSISQLESNNISDKIKIAMDYISALNILATCKYFIGGIAGGTQGVYLMSNGFEYDHLWNLGRYPDSIKSQAKKIYHIIKGTRGAFCEMYY